MLLVYKSFCLPRSRDLRAIDLMFYFEHVAIFESIEVNWGCYWLILLRDSSNLDFKSSNSSLDRTFIPV